VGCIYYPERWVSEEHLALSRYYLEKGDFDKALKESNAAYSLYPKSHGDEALYMKGFIWAHPGNPEQDYGKSKEAFSTMLRMYPQSPLKSQAQTWVLVIREIQDSQSRLEKVENELKKQRAGRRHQQRQYNQRIAAREQQIKDLEQHINNLKRNLDQLKQIDLKIEEKKRKAAP
jgi:tetratricopeptide (TPR) repeat protein